MSLLCIKLTNHDDKTMGDKSSWDSWLNRVLIATFDLFHFKSGLDWEPNPPPPFQCCTGKRQILETENPTLRRGEGALLLRWGKKFALSTIIWQSVSTLLSPIVRDSKPVFAKVTGVVLIWNMYVITLFQDLGSIHRKIMASLLISTKI